MGFFAASGLLLLLLPVALLATAGEGAGKRAPPHRILVDTDVDTDDLFAILYLLKHDRAEFDVQAITINTNSWTDAGHAGNQLYDLLYMMGRDDIAVGVGGEGGISDDGRMYPDIGGYFPIIDQEMSTVGGCRYRQSIPQGGGGRLDINANYGVRRAFLPQGKRSYSPLQQPTTQQVMIDTISAGPTNVFLIGTHTNFALFLMNNPHLKENVKHIYIMGGGVRSRNPTGCCLKNDTLCVPRQCGDHGNMFTTYTKNPYAEFNIFGDPFGAYQVFHSGIPVTLVPLDATNTIPITEAFFKAFEEQQSTYEAQYSFQSLKITRDTWFDDQFYAKPNGENDFAEMELMNITVVTSNEPYGVHDGSNPFFDGHASPKFNLLEGGVHSGHVQTGLDDSFCVLKGSIKGKCQDGYTKEMEGPDSVAVLVAVKAKPNRNVKSPLDREFFENFLEVLNRPEHTGQFNFTNQFPRYKEIMYKPDFKHQIKGKPVIFDMDMSPGDFVALMCLLKAPLAAIDLRGILVSGNGWANPATVDIIYDVLHMMGRDDIPVGLGNITALRSPDLGCEYVKAIPHGSGGFLDTDTLFGLARVLPRSPRRYTAENSVKYGAPRDTAHPELRQPLAFEVWQHIREGLKPTDKITILSNGPLTNIANIILSDSKAEAIIEHIYIVGGHLAGGDGEEGNVFTVPSNKFSEFNFFLDPQAAKVVVESGSDITLIPLRAQRQVASFGKVIRSLNASDKTPESSFVYRLLLLMEKLQKSNRAYRHTDMFLGELLGAVFLVQQSHLNHSITERAISVSSGHVSIDGQTVLQQTNGKLVKVLDHLDPNAYYTEFAKLLNTMKQSAVVGSFDEQKKKWNK
ncbi:uncharacterized protein LOC100842948 isoform X2 [Brachypodium distachyon]|uniref:Inosine/uridine-preferring nucleoside hydrolase domain-containing protein n=1 Tax=Brachypodium distachyon TaxID=15368 RepID=A0A0Q3QYQ7_BRADI|nr:uncharacterized protein LOC100842948 isoform X2 [Brachypodium distachyon]KQK06290.1 hypothetical protein BRADI_2g25527v3 [Brachypodium distachyon]|eukprot:XP_014754446.1 uncharacterized protein LOC100842948 isoform X2 [Brachypodium distachyon]